MNYVQKAFIFLVFFQTNASLTMSEKTFFTLSDHFDSCSETSYYKKEINTADFKEIKIVNLKKQQQVAVTQSDQAKSWYTIKGSQSYTDPIEITKNKKKKTITFTIIDNDGIDSIQFFLALPEKGKLDIKDTTSTQWQFNVLCGAYVIQNYEQIACKGIDIKGKGSDYLESWGLKKSVFSVGSKTTPKVFIDVRGSVLVSKITSKTTKEKIEQNP